MSWTTTADLAREGLADALAHAGASLGTDRPDIQGQRVVELVAWQFGVPLAHALLDGAPLPRLDRIWIGDGAPDPVPDAGFLSLEAWRAHLDAQLEPLVDAVNAATRRPRSALRRGVDDRVAGAIVWIAESTGRADRAAVLATQVIAHAVVRATDDGLLHVRSGCCLYYRVPGGERCAGCPLLGATRRVCSG